MAVLSLPTFASIAVCCASAWGFYTRNAKQLRWQQAFLALHTIYISYCILVAFPPNVFQDTKSPLNAGTEMLKARYSRQFPGSMDSEMDALFPKLGSVDMRLLYFRFGHDVVASCDYCISYTDYALLALPRPLLSYIREMAFMGAMTLPNSPTAHLRSLSLAVLMLAAGAEAYWTLAMPIVMPQPGLPPSPLTYWHDTILTARLLMFLILPFALYMPSIPILYKIPIISSFLPSPSRSSVQAIPTGRALGNLQPVLDHLLPSIQLLKYTRASIMRLPSMRERASEWWANEKLEGDAGVKDANVRRVARGVGLGYDEAPKPGEEDQGEKSGSDKEGAPESGQDQAGGENGKSTLRDNARIGLDAIMRAVRPSEHWIGGGKQQ